jgi:hypothetical protein
VNLDSLTLGQLKEIQSLVGRASASTEHPYEVGQNYFIRTVTHYYTGKLLRVTEYELVLDDAAWIADTGRFSEALAKREFNEVEPFPGKIILGRGAILDASLWDGPLPRKVK